MDATSRRKSGWRHATCCLHATCHAHARLHGSSLPSRCRSRSLASTALLLVSSMQFLHEQHAFVSGLGPRHEVQQARPRRLQRPTDTSWPSHQPEIHVALAALPSISPSSMLATLGPLGFFVAGGLCSSFSHVIATPIDVIKTSQQATEEREGQCPGMLQGLI